MIDFITAHEATLRMSVFLSAILLMMTLEWFIPHKPRVQPRTTRWLSNLSLVVISSLLIRLLLPIAAVGFAAIANSNQWGLFNWLAWPWFIECLISLLLLDMMIYWQHVATHKIPLLWRLHQVHHSDQDVDATTAIRFHPIEMLLSMLYKIVLVLLLGPSVIAVILFELLLNACAIFNHANIKLPRLVDQWLRLLIVTPDMHRVHHSTLLAESNSNFGFSLSCWDRLFSTYIGQPQLGHKQMATGTFDQQTDKTQHLFWALKLPFIRHNKTNSTS